MGKIRKKLGLWYRDLLTIISPELNTRHVFKKKFGREIDLDDPKTLDEKILWLKLNTYRGDRRIQDCADKYAVRKYVEECGCGDILVDLYGAYDNAADIPWDDLPDKFVIKWNFGCHHNIICSDKSKLDIPATIKLLNKWKKEHLTWWMPYSELQYRHIKPKLVVERLIETEDGNPPVDYKLYCFNGEPDCVLLCIGRDEHGEGAKFYFVNEKGELLRYNKTGKEAPADFKVEVPEGFGRLFDYARTLSKPFPFVRADFYLENGKVYFGELTFTPSAGFDPGRLPETQLLFGSKVHLPK